jgi:hypothetical protein
MSEPQSNTTPKSLKSVKVPVLRELLAQLGTEKGVRLVGETCDLMSAALWEAFEKVQLHPMFKSMARGPLEMAMMMGKEQAQAWARRQLPAMATSTH